MTLSPPRPPAPPLNAMRAFESAARHESFVKAGEELNVTASAVAQQVKALESWVGRPLFHRAPKGVRLTAAGRAALPSAIRAFDALGGAVRALRAAGPPTAFRIAALPSVAQLWVAPRLPKLRQRFPDLSVSISAVERPPNLARDAIDLAIFFDEDAPAEGVDVAPLAASVRSPVCAPGVAARLAAPSDLAGETLLHDARWRSDWADWAASVSLDRLDAAAGPVFSLYSLALDEAVQGAGVLMGVRPLIDQALAAGALVRPFDLDIAGPGRLVALRRIDDPDPTAQRVAAALAGAAD